MVINLRCVFGGWREALRFWFLWVLFWMRFLSCFVGLNSGGGEWLGFCIADLMLHFLWVLRLVAWFVVALGRGCVWFIMALVVSVAAVM